MLIELDPVDRITAGATGPPGDRTFYLQARKGDQVVTLILEKQQVQLLAASVVEILARVGKETGKGLPEEEMGLDEPLDAEWRAGKLSVGYHEEKDLILLEAEELLPDDEEESEEGTEPSFVPDDAPEAGRVRFWATREQMLSLARHGALVCAAGRPLCPLCQNPLDPAGHRCPALNGHLGRDET